MNRHDVVRQLLLHVLYVLLQMLFDVAVGFLGLSGGFLRRAASFEFRILGRSTRRLLDLALGFLDATFQLVFVHDSEVRE